MGHGWFTEHFDVKYEKLVKSHFSYLYTFFFSLVFTAYRYVVSQEGIISEEIAGKLLCFSFSNRNSNRIETSLEQRGWDPFLFPQADPRYRTLLWKIYNPFLLVMIILDSNAIAENYHFPFVCTVYLSSENLSIADRGYHSEVIPFQMRLKHLCLCWSIAMR